MCKSKVNINLLSRIILDIYNSELTGPHMPKGQTTWKPPSDDHTQLTGPPPVLSEVVTYGCFDSPKRTENRTRDLLKRRG